MIGSRPGSRKKLRLIKPAAPPVASINVTPLVDVVLVLLIIFMVVTPLLDKKLDVAVPESKQVDSTKEIPQNQLLVQVTKDGKFLINGEEMNEQEYLRFLKEKLAARISSDRIVFVAADEEARYDLLVNAIDRAKQAGATAIGMSTDEPEKGD
jgi:biopolymer transport protein ExbD